MDDYSKEKWSEVYRESAGEEGPPTDAVENSQD